MNSHSIQKNFLLLSLLLVFSSCSLVQKDNTSVYASGSGYEIESVADQLTSVLEAYPTRFTVPIGEGKQSLERAFFFFKTYTSSFTPGDISATDRNINLTSEKSNDATRYRVSRVLVKEGFRYSVSASFKKDQTKSAIMASNLARFIKDGNLEISLLSPK